MSGSSSWWLRRVEEKAYGRLRQLRESRLWDGSPPVPIDHVLEHLLQLSVSWERIEEEPGEEILACLRPETREVILNEAHIALFSEKPGLERFSKGHEAGHADVFALVGESDQLKLLAGHCYRPHRRSATRGPVAILSNRLKNLSPEVRTAVMHELAARERVRRQAGEDSPLERRAVDHYAAVLLMPEDLVREIVTERDLQDWRSLYHFSRELGVTISALIVRLKELDFIFDVVDRTIVRRDPSLQGQGELF